ncbi:MAG: insecticidal toxin complex protein, partial [Bacteroidetes bacterium]
MSFPDDKINPGSTPFSPVAGSAMPQTASNNQSSADTDSIKIPSINLPKGGGALKSIDEKFQVNASNGTASCSFPLGFSKTRNNFSPALSLSYNSGSGNSAFGLGWSCDPPFIQRKTDKKLPQYKDAEESDIFLFSGAEDLVPAYSQDAGGNWQISEYPGTNGESVKRYRPRVDAGFGRIEQITLAGNNTFYWKVVSTDNVVTIFGRSSQARIADPSHPEHIFKWLPEFSYDDRGNCLEYVYTSENFLSVPLQLHEQNRLNNFSPCTNTYLKRIWYGNLNPYPKPALVDAYNPTAPGNAASYMFEAVFDYTDENIATTEPKQDWKCRYEPFSDYKAGFEIRTYRLCRRMLFFHYFKELNDGNNPAPCLVRSLDLTYRLFQNPAATASQIRNAEADYIVAITSCGYIKKSDGSYSKKTLPPVEFSYQELNWDMEVQNVTRENFQNDPVGLTPGYQWTDLWSEGISGILTEQAGEWFYKSNLGDGNFSIAMPVIPKPSLVGLGNGSLQLQDLEADGRKFIVSMQNTAKGYFEITDDEEWQPFIAFSTMPNINFNDPNIKFIDLNGDGKPDLIVSEDNAFTWYANLGIAGYDSRETSTKPYDEEKGPAIVFADASQSIYLSDMSGDGLTDIVRIRNGEICYWPNLGYGKFGAKVNMDFAPVFDSPDLFNPSFLRLADISGTGATDVIYLGKNLFRAWFNLSGNAWSEEQQIDPFPFTGQGNEIQVTDFLGNGTGCIVWSSHLPANAYAPIRYIDLMRGNKPYIMKGYINNFGKETSWKYKSSTQFYLSDKAAGNPWITKLPFPVQCVSQVMTNDLVAGTFFTNSYSYHHGYYDHAEREFRGFGRVEQLDTEDIENFKLSGANNVVDDEIHQAPVKTITWFDTGAYFDQKKIFTQFADEYNVGPFEFSLPDSVIPDKLNPHEIREAHRACKGITLRQEIYAVDGSPNESQPYSVSTHNCIVKLLQPRLTNRFASFSTLESESLTIQYERELSDPRISHTLNLEVDRVGNILKSAAVNYGRKK